VTDDVAFEHFTEVAKLTERMGETMAKITAGRKTSILQLVGRNSNRT
jgi:hypothetical protein